MKKSNDTNGDRNRDLPIYSAVPQPTALRRAPTAIMQRSIKDVFLKHPRLSSLLRVGDWSAYLRNQFELFNM